MRADIHDFSPELVSQHGDGVQMLVFPSESLRWRERYVERNIGFMAAALKVVRQSGLAFDLRWVVLFRRYSRLMRRATGELLFDVFWSED